MSIFEEYLEPFAVSASGRPVFMKDEVQLLEERSLSIYFGEDKKFRKGECILSNQRLFWFDKIGGSVRHAIHLKHFDSTSSKAGFAGMSSPKLIVNLKPKEIVDKRSVGSSSGSSGMSILTAPKMIKVGPPKPGYIKLSFHSGDKDTWSKNIQKSIERQAWVQEVEEKKEFTTQAGGIRGILRDRAAREEKTKATMSSAFEDLDALMKHGKDMVAIANRLARSQEAKDKAGEFDDMLQSIGLASPVTKKAAGSSYHTALAQQLSDFLCSMVERRGGMMALTDVYCVYNRARGSELVSPDDILNAARLMKDLRLPLKLRKFDETGLLVLELASFNDAECARRILKLISENGPLDEMKYSQLAHISITLATQQLLDAEQNEHLCRDESVSGTLFYPNRFKDYVSKNSPADSSSAVY